MALHEKVATIVLAGGLGTRLYPLTLRRCKPSVCFAGKYRLIDIPVSNALNAKLSKIFVLSQHFTPSLQDHIVSTYSKQIFQKKDVCIMSPEEISGKVSWFEGTADAVRKSISRMSLDPFEYVLILSGDQLYNVDLMHMVEFAHQKEADLVIASIPVSWKEATRMGLLRVDSMGEIVDFLEKPKDTKAAEKFLCMGERESYYLGSMGIYVFKKEVLLNLLLRDGNDFGKDIIPMQVQQGGAYSFMYRGYWEDIGTVDSYYHSNLALLDEKRGFNMNNPINPIYMRKHDLSDSVLLTNIKNSIIHEGCFIEADCIENSVIGISTYIGKGSQVQDSIIMGNHGKEHLIIGRDCTIRKAIIDEDTIIGNHVSLVNHRGLDHYDGEGIFIRDGIIIVASGTKVADGFVL